MSPFNFGTQQDKKGTCALFHLQLLILSIVLFHVFPYRYRSIASRFFKGVDGVILVYDITNEESFTKINSWVKQAKENTSKDLPFMLVGNKNDLDDERAVSEKKGADFADELGYPFKEVSALTKDNIDEMFEIMAKMILPKKLKEKADRDEGRKTLKAKSDKKKSGGCG